MDEPFASSAGENTAAREERNTVGTPGEPAAGRKTGLAGWNGIAALVGGIAAAALLIFGILAIVCFLAESSEVMTREITRFAPPETTGLSADLYPEMGQHIAAFLRGEKDSFQYVLPAGEGLVRPLFHDYELRHMEDCRGLIALAERVRNAAGILSAICLMTLFILKKEGRQTYADGGLRVLRTLCILAAGLALWAVFDFDHFFTVFHRLAFTNDLWLLNPRTDLLIRLMPETLFMDLGIWGLGAAGCWLLLLSAGFRLLGQQAKRKKETQNTERINHELPGNRPQAGGSPENQG